MTRTAVVTGATRGIGYELTKELTARGVRVFATGRNASRLEAVMKVTGCAGATANLANPAEVLHIYQAAKSELGGAPSFLVNNAAFNSEKGPIIDSALEEFEAQYAVNLRAPYLLCREALKDMAPRGSGHIVNVLSTTVKHGCETTGVYSTMKHGLHGLNSVLVKEARTAGVKVTAVYPGGTDTEFRPEARPNYMSPASAANVIATAMFAPDDVVMHELIFRPMVEVNF